MTDLERGIRVQIFDEDIDRLESKKGFLPRSGYPEQYEEIAKQEKQHEIGRFLFFRFFI